MDWNQRVSEVQSQLQYHKIDGWLLYDFQGNNPLAREFLRLDPSNLLTRRLFYWIPKEGEPCKILHQIETHALEGLPGKVFPFLKWQELEERLEKVLSGAEIVAMEFSPRCAVPYSSKVDGGTIDLVRSYGIKIVSSDPFIQQYTCVLDEEQFAFHLEAATFLDQLAEKTWEKIRNDLQTGTKIDEYGVRKWIFSEMETHGFTTQGLPICAVNAHSADPHFEPPSQGSSLIRWGDFILIDLWCKKKHPRAVYADITRVAVAESAPTSRQQEIYTIVRKAQALATEFVISSYKKGKVITGCEVDLICRKFIEESGYGPYFTHRTGHNIYTQDHGPGTQIDSLETLDLRELIPKTCFSIEPGIYLPNEFGIRQEYDLFLGEEGSAKITGGIQEKIVVLK